MSAIDLKTYTQHCGISSDVAVITDITLLTLGILKSRIFRIKPLFAVEKPDPMPYHPQNHRDFEQKYVHNTVAHVRYLLIRDML